MTMIKLTWLVFDKRYGPEIWLNSDKVISIFRAPHSNNDKDATCTRICVGSEEADYYDVAEPVGDVVSAIIYGEASP